MKKILSILVIICSCVLFAVGCKNATAKPATLQSKGAYVYVCTGSSATRYHSKSDCRGLCKCSRGIIAISLKEAQEMGRTPCQICH